MMKSKYMYRFVDMCTVTKVAEAFVLVTVDSTQIPLSS